MKAFFASRAPRALLLFALAAISPAALRAQEGREDAPARRDFAPHEEVKVASKLLNKEMLVCVYLPPGYDAARAEKYPVLYYLHGLNNDAKRFFREGLPEITDGLVKEGKIAPFVVACPTGDYSFFVNKYDGSAPYEDYVLQEAIPAVEAAHAVRTDREGRAIGGISMGGYGAMKIAMKNPKLFCAASGHTPFMMEKIPDLTRTDRRSQQTGRMFKAIFGDPIDVKLWEENDPFSLARKGGFDGLALYFNSASKDRYFLNRESNAFHAELEKLQIAHKFDAIDDVHGWVSLRNEWPDFLAFHAEAFGPAAK